MNTVLFVVVPYLAFVVAIGGGIYRYVSHRVTVTSRSSQLLENRLLFWGSVPWHYGIVVVLTFHVVSGLLPDAAKRILAAPWGLYPLEVLAISLAVAAMIGLLILAARRLAVSRVRVNTRAADWLVITVLAVQVGLGIYTALLHRWGAVWYPNTAVVWLRSIVTFSPDTSAIVNLPFFVKAHFFVAFIFIALIPFTRLIHIFTIPLSYLWRPWQILIRNR